MQENILDFTSTEGYQGLSDEARFYMEVITFFGKTFGYAAERNKTGEKSGQRTSLNMKEQLMDLSDGKKRMYLPVGARLYAFNEEHPDNFVFTSPLRFEPEWEGIRRVNDPAKPGSKKDQVFKGRVKYGAVIFDGEGHVCIGMKTETYADFDDYEEKAETGAIGRALAKRGYGTLRAMQEGVIVDAPIALQEDEQEKELGVVLTPLLPMINPQLSLAPTPPILTPPASTNGHVSTPTPAPAPRPKSDAPIQGSRPVTTAATLTIPKPVPTPPAPAPEVVTQGGTGEGTTRTKKQNLDAIGSIFNGLKTKGERDALSAYWQHLGLPAISKEWSVEQSQVALDAITQWTSETAPDPLQLNHLMQYRNGLSAIHLETLATRLCGRPSAKLNATRLAYLLDILDEPDTLMIYELSTQIDTGFKLLTERCGVASPLDLLGVKRTPEQGRWIDYCELLRARAETMAPSEAFQTKYGKVYVEWLANTKPSE